MQTKEEVASRLAEFDYETDLGIREIYRIRNRRVEQETSDDEPIKLLIVNEEAVEAGVMPLGFDAEPSTGIDYHYVLVELSPGEFDQLNAHQLSWPDHWIVGELIPRGSLVSGAA